MDQPLMEAGLDSIGAVELRNAVSEKYGTELQATVMFDHPTIQSLAHYLVGLIGPPPGQFAAGAVTQMVQAAPDIHAHAHTIAQVHSLIHRFVQCASSALPLLLCGCPTGTHYSTELNPGVLPFSFGLLREHRYVVAPLLASRKVP